MDSFDDKSHLFDFSNCGLKRVPQEVLEHDDIQVLTLRNNHLEILPVELFHQLRSLTWLDLRKNQIEELPVEIGMLQDLRCLLLNDNLLISLPNELSLCESLVGLHISGNPIQYPPEATCRKGCVTILSFLRLQYQRQSNDLLEETRKDDKITDAPSLKGDRVPSQYDLWRKSIRPRKVFSDAAVSASKKPSRLELATKSSAFLASDYRIKLRHPALPTANDIAAKGALLKSRKTERAFKANVTRVLEQRRKGEKDEQWRTETRKRQILLDRRIQAGDVEIFPVEVPYGRMGDTVPQLATRKSADGQISSSVYSLSELKTGEEISNIRNQIQNLIQKMNLEQNEAPETVESGEALCRAENYISSLQQMSKLLNG